MANSQKAANSDSSELLALLEAITRDTPLPSGGTELCLVEIDPHRAHVYWNLEAASVDSTRPLCLRVHDITGATSIDQADQSYEIEIRGLHGQWYLDFWRDDRTFVTEVGQRDSSGHFIPLARSNEIHTPPRAPVLVDSGVPTDPHGRPVHTELPAAAPVPAPESTRAAEFAKPDAAEFIAAKFPFEEWRDEEDAASDADADADADAGPSALAEADFTPVQAAGEVAVAFTEEEAEEEWQRGDSFPDAGPMILRQTENREALEAYYHAAAAFPAGSSVPHAEVPVRPATEARPALRPALALEHLMGPSSLDSALRPFLTGLEAELHIRGKIPAGHALTLYGRTLKLNEDGTFSVRRKLVPGSWILPLLFEHGEDDQA